MFTTSVDAQSFNNSKVWFTIVWSSLMLLTCEKSNRCHHTLYSHIRKWWNNEPYHLSLNSIWIHTSKWVNNVSRVPGFLRLDIFCLFIGLAFFTYVRGCVLLGLVVSHDWYIEHNFFINFWPFFFFVYSWVLS